MGIFRFVRLLSYTTKSSPEYKGKVGEQRVSFVIRRLIKEKGGYLIDDIHLPINKDKTTQIDHIYISKYGVFVIETKAYQGIIYGKTSDSKWVIYFANQKFDMYNPIKQNDLHIAAVNTNIKSLVTSPVSIVTILRANISNIHAKNVFNLPQMEKYFLNLKEEVMTNEEVEEIYQEISSYKKNASKKQDGLNED